MPTDSLPYREVLPVQENLLHGRRSSYGPPGMGVACLIMVKIPLPPFPPLTVYLSRGTLVRRSIYF